MNINRLSVFLLLSVMVLIMPAFASAEPFGIKINMHDLTGSSAVDSIPQKQPATEDDKKGDNKTQDPKIIAKKPDIKEVPKAKRKIKPAAVKTKIKIPVKRVKPVIKKPVRLIRRNLGI
jgi:hypothetical protein